MSPDSVSAPGRWSAEALARRMMLEDIKRRRDLHDESHSLRRALNGYHYVRLILKLTGLYGRGWRNFMAPVLTEREIALPNLPEAFDGLRVLHLSDTHFDLEPRLETVVARLLDGVDYDVCLFTGDFRDRLTPVGDEGVELALKLVSGRGKAVYACLGNHDIHTDVERLEAGGIRVLVNESAFIERGGERLYLCGVDDPGYYRTDDFAKAYAGVPEGAASILLAHDPGAYAKAAQRGASLMLCGHTHAGQMCLPGGFAPSTHSECLRAMVHGEWRFGALAGYTSSGVGGSRVAARYFSRGELAIHTLRKRVP